MPNSNSEQETEQNKNPECTVRKPMWDFCSGFLIGAVPCCFFGPLELSLQDSAIAAVSFGLTFGILTAILGEKMYNFAVEFMSFWH